MDAIAKKALIKNLAVASNFNPQLSKVNRKWVIEKVIEHLESQGRNDAQIKSETKTIILEFKSVVRSKRNFKIGLTFKKSIVRQNLKRRVEILYGLLAYEPELRDSSNSKYLDFLAKRRYRSVVRMDYFVNPNSQGYFRYPKKCKQPLPHPFVVNNSATTHWENNHRIQFFMVTIVPSFKVYPINSLKRDPADNSQAINPVQALNLLFTKKKKACEGNLQECGRVLTITHLDGLQEAKNPEQLMRQQISINPDTSFFCIYPVGLYNGVIEYSGPDALFEYKGIEAKDFKVGDHLYIFNHPLYKVFKPTGDWRGEHSLVFNLGNRNIKSPKGYRFGGHGMEGTLYQFYNAFLKNLKTYFTRAFVMARIHLNHMKFGASGLPAGCTFQKQAHTLQLDGQSLPSDIYKYNYEFSYKNFKKNRKRKYLKEKDFLIIQMTAENAFLINGEKDLNVVVSQNKVVNPIPFIRESVVPAGGDVYDHPEWKIVYEDVNNNFQFQPVFKKVKGKITIRHIKRRELFEAPFRYIDPIQKTVPVSQAKVDLSAAYKTFLTSNGAI